MKTMKRFFTLLKTTIILPLVVLLFVTLSQTASAQLGVYEFTGSGTCPNQNPAVTAQPANAVFSDFSVVDAVCTASTDEYASEDWNQNAAINTGEYYQFTITPDAGFTLNLATLSFTHRASENGSGS